MDKLLRTCDIESFYILIRNKKGKGMHSRIEEIFDDPVRLLFLSFKRRTNAHYLPPLYSYSIDLNVKSPSFAVKLSGYQATVSCPD